MAKYHFKYYTDFIQNINIKTLIVKKKYLEFWIFTILRILIYSHTLLTNIKKHSFRFLPHFLYWFICDGYKCICAHTAHTQAHTLPHLQVENDVFHLFKHVLQPEWSTVKDKGMIRDINTQVHATFCIVVPRGIVVCRKHRHAHMHGIPCSQAQHLQAWLCRVC